MDISLLQTSAKGKGRQNSGKKNKEIIKREPIEETPFEIITTEKICFIGMGNYRLSENVEKENKEVLIKRVKERDWMLILYVLNAIIDTKEKLNKLTVNN